MPLHVPTMLGAGSRSWSRQEVTSPLLAPSPKPRWAQARAAPWVSLLRVSRGGVLALRPRQPPGVPQGCSTAGCLCPVASSNPGTGCVQPYKGSPHALLGAEALLQLLDAGETPPQVSPKGHWGGQGGSWTRGLLPAGGGFGV